MINPARLGISSGPDGPVGCWTYSELAVPLEAALMLLVASVADQLAFARNLKLVRAAA